MTTKKVLSIFVLTGLFVSVIAGKGGLIIGDNCNDDNDCIYDIPNSKCDVSSNACVCEDDFYEIDDTYCSQVLGDRVYGCNTDCECQMFVPNSRCINQIVCGCQQGYDIKNNNTCEPDAATADKLLGQCTCRNSGNMVASSLQHFIIVFIPIILTLFG